MLPPITPFFEIGDKVHLISTVRGPVNGTIMNKHRGLLHIALVKSIAPIYFRDPKEVCHGWKK